MTQLDKLLQIKDKAKNESEKANGKILEARRKIKDIENEISFHEGERDVSDYLLSYIEKAIEEIKTAESLTENL
jgi:predicted  nucleic acid-binding Zn-ribbon protein